MPKIMVELGSSSHWLSELPPLGFGCCPMGGHGWGQTDENDLLSAVNTALDLGIKLFDTSDIYGLGASEELLGRALRGRREQAVIATKFGVRYHNGRSFYDTSTAWINTAVDGSLKRLGTDCIDLYQMHYWDGTTPMEEVMSVLESLLKVGKIRSYGISNHDPLDPACNCQNTRIVSYSYPYSLVDRKHEAKILDVQNRSGPVFMSWGSLGQGILSGKYHDLAQFDVGDRRKRAVYANFQPVKFASILLVLDQMRLIATELEIPSLSQLALRWIIDRFPRSLPLVGIKHPRQISDAAAALNFTLTPLAIARLDKLTASLASV